MKIYTLFWLGALALGTLDAKAEAISPSQEVCDKSVQHMRATIRYTTPKGIGYNDGYATVEAFFAPKTFLGDAWLPFLDVRGHVFNNGKFAANAGLGVRYSSLLRLWGGNIYYDYRDTSHQHYNQIAVGLETLGTIWDVRLNGYLPVGQQRSHHFHTKFVTFQGNNLLIRSAYEFALKGANLEVGAHVECFTKAPLYFSAGPYYLTGSGTSTLGGIVRGSVDLLNHRVRIEANLAYDHFFKWTGQGQVGINIPFGPRNTIKKHGNPSCSQAITLETRAMQPVERNEIIPVGTKDPLSIAINPATGLPYSVVFVDNTSSSLGTYESPYPTLEEAQSASGPNGIIYVFEGNGDAYDTSYGASAGMTLQNSQMLLGAGSSHAIDTSLGTITIPPYSSSVPTIINTALSSTFASLTLANNNTVSGFSFENTSDSPYLCSCITGSNISNLIATQNTFSGGVGIDGFYPTGINLVNTAGEITIANSAFNNLGAGCSQGINATLGNDSSPTTLNLSDTNFSNIAPFGNSSISILLFANDGGDTFINLNNIIETRATQGIIITNGTVGGNGDGTMTLNITNSQFNANLISGLLVTNSSDYGSLNVTTTNAYFNENGGPGGTIANYSGYTGLLTFYAIDSQFNNNAVVTNGAGIDGGNGLSIICDSGTLLESIVTIIRSQINANATVMTDGFQSGSSGLVLTNRGAALTLTIIDSEINNNGTTSVGGLIAAGGGLPSPFAVAGIFVTNASGALGPFNVTVRNAEINGNGVQNGGTVESVATGIGVCNQATSTTISITTSGSTVSGNNQYGIYGVGISPGATIIDYSNTTFSNNTEENTNQDSSTFVTWIDN